MATLGTRPASGRVKPTLHDPTRCVPPHALRQVPGRRDRTVPRATDPSRNGTPGVEPRSRGRWTEKFTTVAPPAPGLERRGSTSGGAARQAPQGTEPDPHPSPTARSYATPVPVPYLLNVPALGAQLALDPPSAAARMSSSRQCLRSGRHRSTGASSAAPQGGSITSLASSYYRPPPLRASFSRHPSLRESQVEDPSAHRRAKRRPSFSSAPSPQAPHYSRCPGWQRRCPKQSYRPSSDDGLRVPRSVAS
jgi:hypothetical protein